MPMIRCSDNDGIHGLIVKDPTQVVNGLGRLNVQLFGRRVSATFVHITHIGHFDIRCFSEKARIVGATCSTPNQTDNDLFMGTACRRL